MTDLIPFIERWWDRFETLWLLVAITVFTFSLVILSQFGRFSNDIQSYQPYIYAALIGFPLLTLYWWFKHRIPRNPSNKVGFLVSIRTESARESSAIRRDFGQEVRSLLASSPINVIQLPPPHVNKVIDNDSAKKYSDKCRAHFHVYGDVRKRRVGNKEVYALRLERIIRHAPTTSQNQSGLSHEMVEVLPLKINVPLEDDLRGFEFTSVWMAESTKFVIATAALLSGDPVLAIQLLEELNASKQQLDNKLKKSPVIGIKRLLKKLPDRLASAYLVGSDAQFAKWRETRNPFDLDLAWDLIQKHNKYKKNEYRFFTIKAIWLFVRKRDITGALNAMTLCTTKFIADPTWRYSAAFLEAYRGNEEKALNYYKSAITFGGKNELFFELEEFISWVISEEPGRYQLHYCLGFINYNTKEDLLRAKHDLDAFLGQRVNNTFPQFALSANQILADIKTRMANQANQTGETDQRSQARIVPT